MTDFNGLLMPVDPSEPMIVKHYTHYQQMQDDVGGTFSAITKKLSKIIDGMSTLDMWVNDEGLILQQHVNMRASSFMAQRIVGPAILTGGADYWGTTLSIPPRIADQFILIEMEAKAL